jgi:hypothetical protein
LNEPGCDPSDTSKVPSALLTVQNDGFNFPDSLDFVNDILGYVTGNPIAGFVCWVQKGIDKISEILFGWVGELLKRIPGFANLMAKFQDMMNGFLYGSPLTLVSHIPEDFGYTGLTYGPEYMANEQGRGNAGRITSTVEANVLRAEQRELLAWEQSQKPLLARLFDPSDYQSTISRVARAANLNTSDQSFTTQLANMFKLFGSTPQLLASSFSQMNGVSAYAAGEASWDYGVPTIAFSSEEMKKITEECTDEDCSNNEYEMNRNAEYVLDKIESGDSGWTGETGIASKCFGVTLDAEGNMTQNSNEDGTDWNYADVIHNKNYNYSNNCSGDDMLRLRVYIMDYNIIASGLCYEGAVDDIETRKACEYMGMNSGEGGDDDNDDDSSGDSALPSPKEISAAFEKATNNTGDYDGSYGRQCVDLSKWFLATYTTLAGGNGTLGNGGDVVSNIVAKNSGKVSMSNSPKAPAIFSSRSSKYHASNTSCGSTTCGHTGIVVAVDGNKITTLETWKGAGGVKQYTIEWSPGDSIKFVYLGDVLK